MDSPLWTKVVNISAVVSAIGAAFAAYYANGQSDAAAKDLEESSRIRELDWRPVLNILANRSTTDKTGGLGVYLQNAGKGPAKITAVCQKHPYSELADIDGLLQTRSVVQAGDILKADETVPLVEFRPASEAGWTPPLTLAVQTGLRQLETQGASTTICYESLYRGCFVASRGPDEGKGWLQTRADDCSDPCCQRSK